jgi:hypothetical protein
MSPQTATAVTSIARFRGAIDGPRSAYQSLHYPTE